MLHELLSAEELEVGVLNPLRQDRVVRELEGVLQIQKPDGETGLGRRSAGVGRKAFGVVALVRLPVDQAREHDDRMLHVEDVLQPVHQQVGLSGLGVMGFVGPLLFWLSNLDFDIRSGRRKPRNGDVPNRFNVLQECRTWSAQGEQTGYA